MIDLAALGYIRLDGGSWHRPGTESAFGYNDGDEAENHVARTVREADDVSAQSTDLRAGIRDWPSLYHLTSQRGNVVAPFLDHLTGPVLEIGAGMGAVTRALGESGLEVVAVEGSPRRAAVCADRCRGLPNVQVVADTVQGFGQPRRFGTVVVIGVLEYARVFGFETDRDPIDVMIEHVAGLLEPDGQLILAIENQLGLKYLAGFPEDHTGRRMDGIEDRYRPDTVVTFGREELGRRLASAGLAQQEWFYSFPDYKLPRLVLADPTARPDGAVDPVPLLTGITATDHQRPGTTTFDADRVWDVVHRNGLLPDLANSFIVRASARPRTPLAPLAWHFGGESRRPEFVKTTHFEPTAEGVVVRRRFRTAGEHAVDGLAVALRDEPYLRERPWSGELAAITQTPGWDATDVATWFGTWLTRFREAMLPDLPGDVVPDPGTPVPAEALDAVPRNLLPGSGAFIDLEWVLDEPIDLGYVAFRALWDSLAQLGPVAAPAPRTTLAIGELIAATLQEVGLPVTPADLQRHWARETTFQQTVNGSTTPAEGLATHHLRLERRLDDVLAAADPAVMTELDRLRAVEVSLVAEIENRGTELDRLRAVDSTLTAEAEKRALELDRLRAIAATLTAEIEDRGLELAERGALIDHLHSLTATLGTTISGISAGAERAREAALRESAEADRARADADRARAEAERARAEAERARAEAAARTLYRRLRRVAGRARRRLAGTVVAVRPPDSVPVRAPAQVTTPAPASLPGFDHAYYRRSNPDLAGLDDSGLHSHFEAHGRAEGRRPQSAFAEATISGDVTSDLPVVVLLLHEASRTGAPVLGWNLARELEKDFQVVVVLLHDGELVEDLEAVASCVVVLRHAAQWRREDRVETAREIAERFRPAFVVANSSATAPLAPYFEDAGVPVVALIHEFASSMRPYGVLTEFYGAVSEIVFPAAIVAESMATEYDAVVLRHHHVIAQGPSAVPPGAGTDLVARTTRFGTDGVAVDLPEQDVLAFLGGLDPTSVLVLGVGTLTPRKGVEFFAQAAARTRAAADGTDIVYAWVGHRVPQDQWYIDQLHEQVRRSDTEEAVTFLAPTTHLDLLYQRANLFFLSSRLDPLPNVTIDAALAGIPTVAFEGASGFAAWLATVPELARLVVPHLDAAAAADVLLRLARDTAERARLGLALKAAAEQAFDMPTYTERIVALGSAAHDARIQEEADVADIAASGRFDAELYGGSGAIDADPEALLREYVHRSRLAAPRHRPRTGLIVRRPAPGFHPLSYAEHAPGYRDERDGDPFADFLRRGEPAGPWLRPVLRPDTRTVPAATGLSVLVHGHFHYPDLLPDLLTALQVNTGPVALHLTATSEATAEALKATLTEHAVPDAVVEVVPNLGRDLGPLVTALGRDVLDRYDLVLHVHGKKSVHAGTDVAERWRTFLWENLVGGRHPMADRIRRAFAEDPALGLVFPDDPHLNDWDLNREEGERLATRLGLADPLPQHFDFPMGGMFWARTAALRPLLDLGLGWADYPEEPLPIDGTLLHALERLLPFVAEHAGFTVAKTTVPGVTR